MGLFKYILLVSCTILLCLISIELFLVEVDIQQTKKEATGIVIEKTFTAAHSTETMILVDGVPIFFTDYQSDRWSVNVEIDNKRDSVNIDQKLFDVLKNGQKVHAKYATGRFSGELYIKEILLE